MVRRNFNLGVINGSLWMFGRALGEPETILPAFAVALMGDNPIWVGLLVSVVNAGWFWPPLLVTPALATRQRRLIYYQVSAVVRSIAILAVFFAVKYMAGVNTLLAFWTIALCYFIYTSGGGVGLAFALRGSRRMGGDIGVESESGKGSRFWIELPSA